MKRFYTLLILLVAFISSMIAADITLYYVNSTGWSNVYAYVWDHATQKDITSYPGKKATNTTLKHNGYFIYSFTFDSSKADRIIFNNGGTTVGEDKTQDLVVDASKPYFYDGIWYKDNTFKGKYQATLYVTPENSCTDNSVTIYLHDSDEASFYDYIGTATSTTLEPSMSINGLPVYKIVFPLYDEPVYVTTYKGPFSGDRKLLTPNTKLYYTNSRWYTSLESAKYNVHLADLNQQPEAERLYVIGTTSAIKVYSSKYGVDYVYKPNSTSYKETINGENYYSYEVSAATYDMVIIDKQEYRIDWSKPYFYNGEWYATLKDVPTSKNLIEKAKTWSFYDHGRFPQVQCLGNNIFQTQIEEDIKVNNGDITYTFEYCDRKISKTFKAPAQYGTYKTILTLNANTEEITLVRELLSADAYITLDNKFYSHEMELIGENLLSYTYKDYFKAGLYYYTLNAYLNDFSEEDVLVEIPENGMYNLTWNYDAAKAKVTCTVEKAPSEKITLYYVYENDGCTYDYAYAYAWNSIDGEPMVTYPGEEMTSINKTVDGYTVYSYEIDLSVVDNILFNTPLCDSKTADLVIDKTKPYYYKGEWHKSLEFDTNTGGNNTGGDTPTPTPDPNVAPLYIKLALYNWEANDTYKLTSADGNYYVANYSAGNEITISGNFKISNEDWSVNYGGAFIVEAGKSYTLAAGGANLDTAGKIKASKVEFTLSTGVLKITGTTSSNEFDTTKDQGVAFVVNPRGTSPVYVQLTHSYNAEFQTAQYTGTYTVTELGVTAKIGGLTNFNVIDYGTNGQPVMPQFIYDMVKGAYDGFTIGGDYKVGDVLNILVLFDKDWNSSILINVQEAGTNPTPDPTPDPEPDPTPGGEITLYYVNKTDWSAVNAYVWDFATGTPIVAWSGEPATKLGKTVDGNEVYSYTFDSSLADRIIFNNGNGGDGNQTQDLTFEASKPYFYDGVWYETLTFDTNGGGTVDPTPDPTPDPDPAVPAFIVAGNGGSDATGIWCNGIEWNPSAEANMMKDADKDGIFEITYSNVPAGTWSFKVVANGYWLGSNYLDTVNSSVGYTAAPNDGNIGFTLNAPANVTIKFTASTGNIVLTTPSGNFGKVKIDYFSVANTDECLVENRFTAANNNTLKYTENIQILEDNEYGYAVYRILGNCNYAVYEKNLSVEVTEAGIYDITIVFNGDYDNPDFTVTAVKQGGTIDPDPVVAIKNLMIQPFEQVLPNTTTSTVATFTLQNANTATVSIEGLDADFFEIGEQNIGNGECSISIVFKPIVKGVYYATLVVNTDDEVSLSIDFAAVCGDETFEPGDVPELNPDPVNPGSPDDDINVSVEEVSAIMIYAKEGTIYSEVEFEIYDLAGVNVTKLNGSLQGVYIVKTAEGNRLVSVW